MLDALSLVIANNYNQQEMYCEILQSNNEIITLLEEYDCVINSKDNLKPELSTLIEESGRSKSVQVNLEPKLNILIEKRGRSNVKSELARQLSTESKSNVEEESEDFKEVKIKVFRDK
jgi:hypothetical protein